MIRAKRFLQRFRKWITTFPISLFIGFLLGIILALFIQKLNAFLAGVLLGVILEQLFLGAKGAYENWTKTNPLRIVLGPIANREECYIFFSSFYRDLNKPDEFKLLRWDSTIKQDSILIKGPMYVLGESDGLAVSLIESLLSRVNKNPRKIFVERGDEELDKWGVNCFCIGAHNGKTRVILSKFTELPFVFDKDYSIITKPNAPDITYSPLNRRLRKGVWIHNDDPVATDFGMILKLKDQFQDESKVIFVIAGIGPDGTCGAAYYLLTHYDDLVNLGETFGILVEVPSGYQSARKADFDKDADYYVRE